MFPGVKVRRPSCDPNLAAQMCFITRDRADRTLCVPNIRCGQSKEILATRGMRQSHCCIVTWQAA